jgi:polysaccharide export outer membrane protein
LKACKIESSRATQQFSKRMNSFPSRPRSLLLTACLVLGIGCALSVSAHQREQQTPPPAQPNAQQTPATPPGSNNGPIDERVKPGEKTPTPAPAPGGGGPGAPVDANSYKIGPADVLNIRVWNEQEFSGPVAVQENGKITLPLVGDLDAGGKTPNQVQDIIADALKKYVVHPLVTVTVQEVGSKRYYMDGLVNRPGEYALVVPTTILEAISKAGGLQEFANQKKIYVLRGDQRIPFNYKDVIRGKNMAQNIQLKPGDHVVVH